MLTSSLPMGIVHMHPHPYIDVRHGGISWNKQRNGDRYE